MAQLLQHAPKVTRANYPGDREYTLNALVEELVLVERHLRDESWRLCSCNPEKHLPSIAALASEGQGFASTPDEKEFMRSLQVQARLTRDKIKSGKFSEHEAEGLRAWAREMRHRIEYKEWLGKLSETPELKDEVPESIRKMVSQLNGLELEQENRLSLPEIEEKTAWRMIRFLCEKYNISPPKKITFTDGCNPLIPNAAHIQRDRVTEDGLDPQPELDELVFCRGGVTSYAVAHEFDHYRSHFEGQTVANEGEANEFAFKETRNNLYTGTGSNKLYIATEHKNNLTKGMAIDKKKGLTVFVGLGTAKLVEKYVSPALDTPLGAYAAMGKLAIGAGLVYYGLAKAKEGILRDIVTFAGAELVLTEVLKFVPGGTVLSAPYVSNAPIAIPMAPGHAVISAASQYSRMYATPTRLTAGYPGVAQVDGKWVDQRV